MDSCWVVPHFSYPPHSRGNTKDPDYRDVCEAQGQNCKMRRLESAIEASRRGKKQGNLRELNLEALLDPCRLLLSGGFLFTSNKTKNNFDLDDEAPWSLRPKGKLPPLPLPHGGPAKDSSKCQGEIWSLKIGGGLKSSTYHRES